MRVSERMTRDVEIAAPGQTIREAAQIMALRDIGALPVADGDRLIGVVTDRDIAVRAVASGKSPETLIREVMSPEIKYCYEDQNVEDVMRNMADIQVRRLPVVNRDKRLVGVISLGDLTPGSESEAGEALREISRQGGEHSQASVPRPS
jgi:CBS domain-containing protein